MYNPPENIQSTIIISVYTDTAALQLVLESLQNQINNTAFEIIISEDGKSKAMKRCVSKFKTHTNNILHITQDDKGFRKNIALNNAIKSASCDHIIFIDGDCIPHPKFIAAHQLYAKQGIACTGRRLEIGKQISQKIRNNIIKVSHLANHLYFFPYMLSLMMDKSKNIECGIYSTLLQKFTQNRPARLLGCNFSCNKHDLIKINGFNEDYLEAGTGEDSDIDWRLMKYGVRIKKIKFSAIQYHLFHPRSYGISERNIELLKITKASDSYYCSRGLKR